VKGTAPAGMVLFSNLIDRMDIESIRATELIILYSVTLCSQERIAVDATCREAAVFA